MKIMQFGNPYFQLADELARPSLETADPHVFLFLVDSYLAPSFLTHSDFLLIVAFVTLHLNIIFISMNSGEAGRSGSQEWRRG